jgi:hypothetical protein
MSRNRRGHQKRLTDRLPLKETPLSKEDLASSSSDPASPPNVIFGLPLLKAIEIAIVVITIPLLSYLAMKVTSLDTTVTSANLPDLVKGVTTTKDRVDILYDALPRMRVQIAEERVNAPVHMAVVAIQPGPSDPNAHVQIVDFDRKTRQIYTLPPDVAARPDYALRVKGAAVNLDERAASFAEYQGYLRVANKTSARFPASVDQQLSFAITEKPSAADLGQTVHALTASFGVSPRIETFNVSPTSFDQMAMQVSLTPTISGSRHDMR